jgi:hypothetical protein
MENRSIIKRLFGGFRVSTDAVVEPINLWKLLVQTGFPIRQNKTRSLVVPVERSNDEAIAIADPRRRVHNSKATDQKLAFRAFLTPLTIVISTS